MAIPLEPIRLDDVSEIRARFARGASRRAGGGAIIVVSYTGTYRDGSAGNPDSQYMCAMAKAAILAWKPVTWPRR